MYKGLILLLLASVSFSAELLVLAKGHWMDGISTDKMTAEQYARWQARPQQGDIIAVKPDGWKWGKRECPPDFYVIKIDVPYEEAKQYEACLIDNGKLLKQKRYKINVDLSGISVTDKAKE